MNATKNIAEDKHSINCTLWDVPQLSIYKIYK